MLDVSARDTPAAAGRADRTPLDLFAVATAFLLPVVFSPSTNLAFWSAKNAFLPLVAAVGLGCLATLVRDGSTVRKPARAAAVFLALATVSAALAPNLTTALFGVYGVGTGLLFVAALVGAWAIGTSLGERARREVGLALLVGITVNCVVALLSVVIDLSRFELGLYGSRAMGLEGNPIHLGAMAAGGLALAAGRLGDHPHLGGRSLAPLGLVALLAATIEVSGTRSGLVSGLAVLAWSCHRLGRRRGAALLLAAALGFGAGGLVARVGGGVSVSDRLAESAGGVSGRVDSWWAARGAVADRPLLGIGPGGYRQATSRYAPLGVARSFGPGTYFADAHNFVVEYAVTTGLLGLAALSTWLVLAAAGARGSLAVAALGVLAVGLVEPQWPGTTPLAFLALGAAGPLPGALGRARVARALAGGLVAGGLALTLTLLVGEFHLDQARLDFDVAHADQALRLLPHWPEPAAIRSRIDTYAGRTEQEPARVASGIAWLEEAVRRDPTDPSPLLALADAQASAGRHADALETYQTVVAVSPTSIRACNALAQLSYAAGDLDASRTWLRRSLTIVADQPAAEDLLRQLGG